MNSIFFFTHNKLLQGESLYKREIYSIKCDERLKEAFKSSSKLNLNFDANLI